MLQLPKYKSFEIFFIINKSSTYNNKKYLQLHFIKYRLLALIHILIIELKIKDIILYYRLFPHAHMTRMDHWSNFGEKYCCPYLIDPTDPLFKKIGKAFMEEVRNN